MAKLHKKELKELFDKEYKLYVTHPKYLNHIPNLHLPYLDYK